MMEFNYGLTREKAWGSNYGIYWIVSKDKQWLMETERCLSCDGGTKYTPSIPLYGGSLSCGSCDGKGNYILGKERYSEVLPGEDDGI